MTNNLTAEVEDMIKSDPSKFIFYALSRVNSKLVRDPNYREISYRQNGKDIIIDIDVNELMYKRFEMINDRFSGFYSVVEKGCFLKENIS